MRHAGECGYHDRVEVQGQNQLAAETAAWRRLTTVVDQVLDMA
ncbi:MAG TPA: hypothetical protein VMU80_01940 [Bryobacteraceae bacterium]|nr:hypothetical protein [Bryobacteraceae bacterium]